MSASYLERIIYVDDEPHIRAVAQLSLETVGGFKLMLCESGAEALASAETFAPDLILLDVMMPAMDGPATLAELRKIDALKETPVVFMTAKAQSHEIVRYLSLGAAGVVPKPFSPLQLPDQLRAIWADRVH